MSEWQGRLVDYFCVCGVDPEDAASQELIQSNAGVTPRLLQALRARRLRQPMRQPHQLAEDVSSVRGHFWIRARRF